MSNHKYFLLGSTKFVTTSRDVLDSTINFAAHSKFVEKWLGKLETDDPSPQAPKVTDGETQEAAST